MSIPARMMTLGQLLIEAGVGPELDIRRAIRTITSDAPNPARSFIDAGISVQTLRFALELECLMHQGIVDFSWCRQSLRLYNHRLNTGTLQVKTSSAGQPAPVKVRSLVNI